MGDIKSLAEVIRERMKECVANLVKSSFMFVRPIYGVANNGNPNHLGSCVLVELNRAPYLITAAHLIDSNEDTTLYVGGENEFVELEANAIITIPDSGDRRDDMLDFAVLPLSASIVKKLGAVCYLKESNFANWESSDPRGPYMAYGYPNSKNKTPYDPAKKVRPKSVVYSGTLKRDESVLREIGVGSVQHLMLNFDSKYSYDETGIQQCSISPIGMSGGGLFFIGGMSSPEMLRSGVVCPAKLVGIPIKLFIEHDVILATRIGVVTSVIS